MASSIKAVKMVIVQYAARVPGTVQALQKHVHNKKILKLTLHHCQSISYPLTRSLL